MKRPLSILTHAAALCSGWAIAVYVAPDTEPSPPDAPTPCDEAPTNNGGQRPPKPSPTDIAPIHDDHISLETCQRRVAALEYDLHSAAGRPMAWAHEDDAVQAEAEARATMSALTSPHALWDIDCEEPPCIAAIHHVSADHTEFRAELAALGIDDSNVAFQHMGDHFLSLVPMQAVTTESAARWRHRSAQLMAAMAPQLRESFLDDVTVDDARALGIDLPEGAFIKRP